ncbi:MAG: YihY/virulence factor BrkB family protein [Bacteroidaceae bacterium]|nr:YihY/virulence factor BrkB family protein [Bacteroidaceae bacterium]
MVSLEHIWSVNEKSLSWPERLGLKVLKRFAISWECITKNNIMNYASSLTYSSMLAAVPVLAIIFAIARGFGFDTVVETRLRSSLEGNSEIADTILYFVESYLQHTKGGVFIGIGLIFLLYTLVSLTSNVEQAFNTIWHVKRSRSIYRQIIDYFSIFLLIPFVVVIISGLGVFLQTFKTLLPDIQLFSKTMTFALRVSPIVFASLAFMVLYTFMPNTRVKWKHTIWPSILAGTAFMIVEWVYVHYQIKLSAYNAIYGSFAAIPLFMLWMQISWYICLFGAQLCYANQSLHTYAFERISDELSRRYRDTLILLLMSRICKHFSSGLKPFTAHRLAVDTHLPDSLVDILLGELTATQLLVEVHTEGGNEPRYLPAIDIHRITVGMVIRRIDSHGIENPSLVWQTGTPEWDRLRSLRNENEDALLVDL